MVCTFIVNTLGKMNYVFVSSVRDASDEDEECSMSSMEMLKSPDFYFLWAMFLCNGQGQVFIASLYKVSAHPKKT